MSTLPVEDIPASSSKAVSASPLVLDLQDEAAISASSTVVDSASSSILIAPTETPSNIPEYSSERSPLVDPFIPGPTDEAAVSASSVIQESLLQSSESSVLASSTLSQISSEPSSTNEESPLAEEEEPVEDLTEFLAGIGFNDDPGSDTPPVEEFPQPPPPPPVHEETEQEKEERLRREAIETAEKRADIEGRHTQWEIDLETFGKAQRKVVRAALNRLREAAVEEARAPGAAIRMHVDGLLQEAEKSFKSLKGYARKLSKESKPEKEKVKIWENVVNKVEKKFGERVDAAADHIRDWWSDYVNKEVGQVNVIGSEVEELATRAQADLGMDYAWLRDVTYEDWQRYHKLLDTSKKFAGLYLSMQNGTHKTAPPNPLIDVMEALQEEVDDMVLGFEANLTRVKNEALGMFSGIDIKMAKSTPETVAESEPEVSILPIDPIAAEIKDGEIPPVILSRGAEEVQAALSRAEEAKTKTAREEL